MAQNILPYILFIGLILVCVSPIYFQNRRIRRSADEHLKELNPEDWAKQSRYSLKATLFGRILLGAAIVGYYAYLKIGAPEFSIALFDFVQMFWAAAVVLFAIWRYRVGMAKIDDSLNPE